MFRMVLFKQVITLSSQTHSDAGYVVYWSLRKKREENEKGNNSIWHQKNISIKKNR